MGERINSSDIIKYAVDATINVATNGNMSGNGSRGPAGQPPGMFPPSRGAVYGITFFFSLILVVGIIGNLLVIYAILSDRKMRSSVTNLFIINLAIADFLIMIFGVTDVVLFAIDRGWLLGEPLCKFQRFIMTCGLYVSVMTLLSLCVERYIAIVYPIKAHIFCSRKRILGVIACVWPLAVVMGLPTVLYNIVKRPPKSAQEFCLLVFSGDRATSLLKKTVFKFIESGLFYIIPLVIQICLYTVIGIRLFAGTSLHRRQTIKSENGVEKEKSSDAIRARKGVVKMLVACIIIYFLCYLPPQVLLFYVTFSSTPFHMTWNFQVFGYALAYINSAANPIMYSIFSQNFRRKFKKALVCRTGKDYKRSTTLDSFGGSRATTRFTSLKQTAVSEM
ncbi:neuropeptide receptor 15-like [Lineus longissimus]|uniref:neuropeptide receptor 15-like n=1 Tax=Lineus longissimus TaxID=88925 RepID=UPI002B4E4059